MGNVRRYAVNLVKQREILETFAFDCETDDFNQIGRTWSSFFHDLQGARGIFVVGDPQYERPALPMDRSFGGKCNLVGLLKSRQLGLIQNARSPRPFNYAWYAFADTNFVSYCNAVYSGKSLGANSDSFNAAGDYEREATWCNTFPNYRTPGKGFQPARPTRAGNDPDGHSNPCSVESLVDSTLEGNVIRILKSGIEAGKVKPRTESIKNSVDALQSLEDGVWQIRPKVKTAMEEWSLVRVGKQRNVRPVTLTAAEVQLLKSFKNKILSAQALSAKMVGRIKFWFSEIRCPNAVVLFTEQSYFGFISRSIDEVLAMASRGVLGGPGKGQIF
jgi:hypothetical protein